MTWASAVRQLHASNHGCPGRIHAAPPGGRQPRSSPAPSSSRRCQRSTSSGHGASCIVRTPELSPERGDPLEQERDEARPRRCRPRPLRSAPSPPGRGGRRSFGPAPALLRSRPAPRCAPSSPTRGETRARARRRRGSASRPSRTSRDGNVRRTRAARQPSPPPGRRRAAARRAPDRRAPCGDVEADHRHVEAAREHAVGRLRIAPDVELRRRRHVPLADRAAHQDDPVDPGRASG